MPTTGSPVSLGLSGEGALLVVTTTPTAAMAARGRLGPEFGEDIRACGHGGSSERAGTITKKPLSAGERGEASGRPDAVREGVQAPVFRRRRSRRLAWKAAAAPNRGSGPGTGAAPIGVRLEELMDPLVPKNIL
jgi:hypothetical protein